MAMRPLSPGRAPRTGAGLGTTRRGGPPGGPTLSSVPYLPGLDGIRAIAVVAVMIYHANHDWLKGGYLGVEVFFVISGYLITLLLIAEHERNGHVDLRQFWMRRFRRLLPALFVMLALLMLYLVIAYRDARGNTRGDLVAAVGYVSNWFQIWSGAGYTAGEALAPLRHLWSLAVEEQFYVLWPLVMVAILRRGRDRLPRVAMWLFGLSVAIALVVAVLYVPGDVGAVCADTPKGYWTIGGRCISINDTLYLSTITRAGGLMLGAGFAMLWRPMAVRRGAAAQRPGVFDGLAVVGVLVLLAMFVTVGFADASPALTGTRYESFVGRGGMLVAGLASLTVIAAVTHPFTRAGGLLGNKALVWIGTRSYGLYLYHWPIYQLFRKQSNIDLTTTQLIAALALTVALTEASYRLVETPIRKGALSALWSRKADVVGNAGYGARSGRGRAAAALGGFVAVIAVTGMSVASAPLNDCLGEVNARDCAAREALAEQTSPTQPDVITTTPGGTTPIDPGTTPTTPPGPTTIPVDQRAPIAVGESVMRGALPQLQDGGFAVYAEENKGPNWVRDTLQSLSDANQIGATVVVQVGTNGPVSTEQYDAIMAVLAETPQVVFLTVKAPKDYIDDNNERIRALPGRYPNVKVLEWDGLAAQVEDGLSKGDGGVHLASAEAQQYYANIIFDITGNRDKVIDLSTV